MYVYKVGIYTYISMYILIKTNIPSIFFQCRNTYFSQEITLLYYISNQVPGGLEVPHNV